ncbi:hypothetical protein [Pseudonocardia oceani]|uniref:hypothetical protein n=1 Tax=Pseudonocardia oceani TaxID=2792013 RepID=UPI003557BC59
MFASALAAGATVLNASSRGVTAASLSVGWVDARAGMSRSDASDAAHNSADQTAAGSLGRSRVGTRLHYRDRGNSSSCWPPERDRNPDRLPRASPTRHQDD